MDAELSDAIAASHLCGICRDLLARLMAGAVEVAVPAGSVTHWEGERTSHLELVVSGVVRVYVTAPDGRTMTIRYCRRGALLGAMSLFTTGFSMPATTQALVDTTLLKISPAVARDLTGHREVAHALLRELSERARDFLHEIAGGAFATVRQRVARHLLDLASDRVREIDRSEIRERELVVLSSQQELAEAAGTVREVVVRILRDLREDGLVRTERNEIVLLDPARMIEEEEWNLSS